MSDLAKRFIKLISAVTALSFIFLLASCGTGGASSTDAAQETESEGPDFEAIEKPAPYSVQDFELTDVLGVFKKQDGAVYVVSSDNFGVDSAVFDALFNLTLYREKTVGDGFFDEFDEYFASGALDPEAPVKGQTVPDGKNMYWYAECRNRALVACFNVLRYFEYASEYGISPISRINEARVNEVLTMTSDGTMSGPLSRWFGSEATAGAVRAAAALFAIADDPSAFTAEDGLDLYRYPEYYVDENLQPQIAEALQ